MIDQDEYCSMRWPLLTSTVWNCKIVCSVVTQSKLLRMLKAWQEILAWVQTMFRLQSLHLCDCFSKPETSTKLLVRNHHFNKNILPVKARTCKLHYLFRGKGMDLTMDSSASFCLSFSLCASRCIAWWLNLYIYQKFYHKTTSGAILKLLFFLR